MALIEIQVARSCRAARRLAAAAALLLGACGGGGGGGGGAAPPTPSASLSTLSADRTIAPANGTTPVLLVASVRNADGQPLGGRQITFEATGSDFALQPATLFADGGGIATTLLTAATPGPVTVSAVVGGDGIDVRLDQIVTIDFVPLVAPVAVGIARYQDADRSESATAGDRLVVTFSQPVLVDGANTDDFELPVEGDSFGAGATVAAGPAPDEVTITLGIAPRLRTRGRFAASAVAANEPSGIGVRGTIRIRNSFDGSPAVATPPLDIGPGLVALPGPPLAAPTSLAVAQASLDARRDLVVARGDTLQPWLGDGALGYAPGPLLGLVPVQAIAIAELNGLPVDEVLTAHGFGVQVWNNQPFAAGATELVAGPVVSAADVRSVLAIDLDRDAFPDVIAGTATGLVAALHQRDVDNSLAIVQTLGLGGPVAALAGADLDGDGDADVLAALPGADAVLWLRNDGGTLVEAASLPLAGARAVAVADLDRDGRIDVVAAGADAVRSFRNTAAGFVPSAIGAAADEIALVDLDRDAFADLLLRTAERIELWLNDRTGAFEPFTALGGGPPVAWAHGDLDGDADLDIVVAAANATTVFAGGAAGTFGATTFVPSVELGAAATGAQALGDLDGDGDLDRVAATATGVEVWFGDGAGGFVPGGIVPAAGVLAAALGDLDGDLDLDLVLGRDGQDFVFANDGAGSFTFAQDFAPDTDTRALALADTDGDGDLDIVLGNDGANHVFRNDSAAGVIAFVQDPIGFVLLPPEHVERATIALLAWDADHDGDQDLLVVNGGSLAAPQETVLMRNTDLGYVVHQVFRSPLLATAAALGDVDGDGRADVVIARASASGEAMLHLHRGLPTALAKPAATIAAPGARAIASLALADLDGDGRTDVAVADARSDQPTLVLRQLPAGTFAVEHELETRAATQVAAGDLDHDGDVDLVTVEVDGPSRVFANR